MSQALKILQRLSGQIEANHAPTGLQKDTAGFLKLAAALAELTGIHLPLSDKNLSLMASRLGPVLRKRGMASYGEYLSLLEQGEAALIQEFIDQLTTNTTHFFREDAHFNFLREQLPRLVAEKPAQQRGELRMLCAPCSTGQEAFSLAVTALEALGSLPSPPAISLLATDIDSAALAKAAAASYTKDEIESLPALYRMKYFEQHPGRGQSYRARPQLRRLVTFAQFNLTAEAYPFEQPFDVIFCRNVLIYFDRPTAMAVIGRLTRALAPKGYLFLGHSETGVARSPQLRTIGPAIYQRVG